RGSSGVWAGPRRTERSHKPPRSAAQRMDGEPLADCHFRGRRRAELARAGGAAAARFAERGDEPPVGSSGARHLSGGDDRRRARALCRGRGGRGGRRRSRRFRHRRGRVMKNIGQLMKQAQEMQAKMAEVQAQLEAVEMTGAAGGGLVQLTLNGKGDLKKIKIDRSLLVAEEVEVLEDLIVAAFTDARSKVTAHPQQEMQELTGGLQLPGGMKLPF